MTNSERIRLIRQQKNISQNELAKAAGINVKSLSRYKLGTSVPPANALKAIADTLGVSADALLSYDTVQIKDKELFKKFEAIQDMAEIQRIGFLNSSTWLSGIIKQNRLMRGKATHTT